MKALNRKIIAIISMSLIIFTLFTIISPIYAVYDNLGYLQITDDGDTDMERPNTNYESYHSLSAIFNVTTLSNYINLTTITWIKIDTSALIHQYSFVGGKLALNCYNPLPTVVTWSSYIMAYYNPNDTWSENTITWSTQPQLTNDLLDVQIMQDVDGAHPIWLEFDITSAIRRDLSVGDTMTTIVIAAGEEINHLHHFGGMAAWSTEYADSQKRPYVEVTCPENFPGELEGDVNGDCHVNIGDIGLVGANWQKTFPYINPPATDLNNDGIVNIQDTAIISAHWQEQCGGPIAYSSEFKFEVPNDGNAQMWYNIMLRVYVPGSYQHVWFRATEVDDWILNVKVDGQTKYAGSTSDPGCQPVILDLGRLYGYHTISFDLAEQWSVGVCRVCIAPNNDENLAAKITRFRVYVPDYSDNKYEYTVKTRTYFPGDDFFLGGYADDYIGNVTLDVGLLWHDWMWDMGPYGAIYSWGDGFMYPLGWLGPSWHDITFTYGEIWGRGLLDFQYFSRTNQRDKIGLPKFYAISNANGLHHEPSFGDVNWVWDSYVKNAKVYGGSKWNGTAVVSDRQFLCQTMLDFNSTCTAFDYNGDPYILGWVASNCEIGLGIGWAKPELTKGLSDIGVTYNVTFTNFTYTVYPYTRWEMGLRNCSIDIYSYYGLPITEMEFTGDGNIASIVNPDWTAALDYGGSIVVTISAALGQPIGVGVGLAMSGIATLAEFIKDQPLPQYIETIAGNNHRRENLTGFISNVPPYSKTSAVFFKLNPNVGCSCGLISIVLSGTLTLEDIAIFGGIETNRVPYPIANIYMTISIPCFIWD